MGLFDLLFGSKKKERERQELLRQQQETEAKQRVEEQCRQAEASRRAEEQRKKQEQSAQDTSSSNLFSKQELENLISILSRISYIFQASDRLVGGRNQTMMSRTHSYAGILGYLYEVKYQYGKMADIVDSKIAQHFTLVMVSMLDPNHKKKVVSELAANWSDVLQVIYNLQLDSNSAGNQLKDMEPDIQKVTAAFEKLSGSKCRKPQNPLQQTAHRNVNYNPYNITEDPNRSDDHIIPDITHVFAQELLPQMASADSMGRAMKDVVAGYAISMIKSYYDNAGFVPMIIVDQITGQINQVAEMAQHVSYSPQSTLKEYVLSKIYK